MTEAKQHAHQSRVAGLKKRLKNIVLVRDFPRVG
jgi:hypothetical protein